MKRLLLLVLLPALAFAQPVTRDGVTLTQAQERRAEAIGDQLRCLVCQNESIEDSSASLAGQLRTIIRQQVVAGEPDRKIMNFMVQRYGIFILLKPPLAKLTWLLYAMPVLALGGGFLIYALGRRRKADARPLSEAERRRVDELLR